MPAKPPKLTELLQTRVDAETFADFKRACESINEEHPLVLRWLTSAAIAYHQRWKKLPKDMMLIQEPQESAQYAPREFIPLMAAEDPEPAPKRGRKPPPKDLPALDVDRPA